MFLDGQRLKKVQLIEDVILLKRKENIQPDRYSVGDVVRPLTNLTDKEGVVPSGTGGAAAEYPGTFSSTYKVVFESEITRAVYPKDLALVKKKK